MPMFSLCTQSGKTLIWMVVSVVLVALIIIPSAWWLYRTQPMTAPTTTGLQAGLPASESAVPMPQVPQCEEAASFNSLTAALEQPEQVCQLSLHDDSVDVFLQNIDTFTNLKILHLAGQDLTAFPVEITKLTQLTVLNLSKNRIAALPPEISTLQNLQYLVLRENPITLETIKQIAPLVPRAQIVY